MSDFDDLVEVPVRQCFVELGMGLCCGRSDIGNCNLNPYEFQELGCYGCYRFQFSFVP